MPLECEPAYAAASRSAGVFSKTIVIGGCMDSRSLCRRYRELKE